MIIIGIIIGIAVVVIGGGLWVNIAIERSDLKRRRKHPGSTCP